MRADAQRKRLKKYYKKVQPSTDPRVNSINCNCPEAGGLKKLEKIYGLCYIKCTKKQPIPLADGVGIIYYQKKTKESER